jgi:Fe2+ transport system protein FeoA
MSLVWTPEVIQRGSDSLSNTRFGKLSEVSSGLKITICDTINTSDEFLRLAEMGFTPKSVVKVIKNDGKNPLIIQTKNVKLMIARKLAEDIYIEL